MSMPRVMILAGGRGTRLAPRLRTLPKSLAPVAGRPFLAWQLEFLRQYGFEEITLCVGAGARRIEETFGDGTELGLRLGYSEETRPLGTGGALRLAWTRLRPERAVVLNGDSILALDLREFLAYHDGRRSDLTMALARVEGRDAYGSVELGPDDRVIGFREKEGSAGAGWINGGVYLVEGDWFEREAGALGEQFSLEKDLFPALGDREGFEFHGYRTRAFFLDIGTPERYERAQTLVPENL